jgi:REP element-mobilizing transposase RayT
MCRPLRLEYPDSLWHVTVRGNARQNIFRDDSDRQFFLELLGACVKRFAWILTACVLMSNHFHLVVQLTCETLSRGMHWLNASYSQTFNRRHDRVGHLFQGRFNAFLIEKEAYSLEVLHYVVLNPVRARIVTRPEDYIWSSHRAVIGEATAPEWLAVDDVLVQFGSERDLAQAAYRQFVDAAIGSEKKPWNDLVNQIYLGRKEWIEAVHERVNLKPRADEHPRAQRVVGAPSMATVVAAVARTFAVEENLLRRARGGIPRMMAAWLGWHEALLTNRDIAAGLRLQSSGHVSDLIRRCDRELDRNPILRDGLDRCLSTIRGAKGEPKT